MKRFLFLLLLLPLVPAGGNESPGDYFREKAACWSESLGCAKEEAESLARQVAEKDLEPAMKEITARLAENARKIVSATDAGIAAAGSASRKAVQAAEDEISSLQDANSILHLKREAICEVDQLKKSATTEADLSGLAQKVEKSYADFIANEEAAAVLKAKGQALRREIENLKRQLRIAQLEREKRQLEAE